MPRSTSENTLLVREGIRTAMTSVRCEIRHVAELARRAFDSCPLGVRQRLRIPEKTGRGDRAHSGELGDLRQSDLARFGAFSSHLLLIAQPFLQTKER